jgi:hypothetical protein
MQAPRRAEAEYEAHKQNPHEDMCKFCGRPRLYHTIFSVRSSTLLLENEYLQMCGSECAEE